MPRISKQPRITALGEFVRRERQLRGKTQKKFEELLGIEETHKLYVSKVETGAILHPGKTFMEALARLTGRPMAEIKAMAGGGESEAHSSQAMRFEIAFGHCVWATPLVLARAEDEHLPFRFASVCKKQDGPLLFTKEELQEANHNEREYLSAVEAKERLLKGKVDVAGLPGEVIKDDDKDILRIATIVDSSLSCTLLLKKQYAEELKDGAHLTVDDFLKKLLKSDGKYLAGVCDGNQEFPFHLGIRAGTIAQKMLESGVRRLDGREVRKRVGRRLPKHIERDFFHDSEAAKRIWGEETTIGVLTWEPQATWLQKNEGVVEASEANEALKPVKVKLFFPLGIDGRPDHLSFELAMLRTTAVSENGRHRELRARLASLIDALDRHSSFLNNLDDDTTIPPEEKLKIISDYFELPTLPESLFPYEPALHIIGGIRYSVKWNPEAIELMQFRPQL